MICDICGLEPCQTPAFCNECRRLDKDPGVLAARMNAFAKLPDNWETMPFGELYDWLGRQNGLARSTIMAADFLTRFKDDKRLRDWIDGHSDETQDEILEYLLKKARHG